MIFALWLCAVLRGNVQLYSERCWFSVGSLPLGRMVSANYWHGTCHTKNCAHCAQREFDGCYHSCTCHVSWMLSVTDCGSLSDPPRSLQTCQCHRSLGVFPRPYFRCAKTIDLRPLQNQHFQIACIAAQGRNLAFWRRMLGQGNGEGLCVWGYFHIRHFQEQVGTHQQSRSSASVGMQCGCAQGPSVHVWRRIYIAKSTEVQTLQVSLHL